MLPRGRSGRFSPLRYQKAGASLMFDAEAPTSPSGARSGSEESTPATTVIAAAQATEAHSHLRFTSRTQRNPMLSFRLSGSFLLRLAARRFLGLLFHDPPRKTRTMRPHASSKRELPKKLLAQPPGVTVGCVGNPRSNSPT